MSVIVEAGDCRDTLRMYAECGIAFDSCVVDPPYHLASIVERFGGTAAAPVKSSGPSGVYRRAAAGFMGKQWDGGDIAFDPATWRLVLDVLKPGAHLVAFGAPKNYHRLAVAIEDAGFEIRNSPLFLFSDRTVVEFLETLSERQAEAFLRCIEESQFGGLLAWIFGTGFPKSDNIGKRIAKMRREDEAPQRVVCRFVRAAMDAQSMTSRDLVHHFGDCHSRLIDHWAARDTDSQPATPTMAQWAILKAALDLGDGMDAEVERLNDRKGRPGDDWNGAEVIGEYESDIAGFGEQRFSVRDRLIRRLTEEAANWEDWGTDIKPAYEPIVLARKPLAESSIARQVLATGTGALNIGGCRVSTDGRDDPNWRRAGRRDTVAIGYRKGGSRDITGENLNDAGRFPANVLHDGSAEVLDLFAAFGQDKGQAAPLRTRNTDKTRSVYGAFAGTSDADFAPHDAPASAARFFYSAKASSGERVYRCRTCGAHTIGKPSCGHRELDAHPTVKPVEIMRWLCRLVTPPGGVILDPFAGTGTTGVAAILEGFSAVLCEREADYLADINLRLDAARAQTPARVDEWEF